MICKHIKQTLIYTFEIVLMSLMITWILSNCFDILHSLEYFERLLIGYTLYQLLIYIVLKINDDIQRDESVAFLSFLKYVQLHSQNDNKELENIIIDKANKINDKSVFMNRILKMEIKSIADNINDTDIFKIQMRIIDMEHKILLLDQKWRLSFLLRFIK